VAWDKLDGRGEKTGRGKTEKAPFLSPREKGTEARNFRRRREIAEEATSEKKGKPVATRDR